MLKAKYLAAILLFFCFYTYSQAQQLSPKDLTDEIADKMEWYGINKPESMLFIHFDKNIYSPDESVWFTGYFFNLPNKSAYQTLSVALVKDDDHRVLSIDKFMVRNSLCFGNMIIPDTASTGNYSFIAFTNRLFNGKPDILFTQKITIRGSRNASYYATLNPLDTAVNNQHQRMLLMVTNSSSNKELPDVPINFYVGDYKHPVLKGQAKTKKGQYIFDVPSKLLYQGNNRLHVCLQVNNETNFLSIDLPAKAKPSIVHFFPEGGNLVQKVENIVAWEVKSPTGIGMSCRALLYDGQKVIDTINTDSYGFGKFNLIPQANKIFSVKLINTKVDTIYYLPAAIPHIVKLSVLSAVVNNELYVDLKAAEPQRINLMVHDYKELFSNTVLDVTPAGKRIKILLDAIPKGLAKITLTDSLGRPLAERSFFAHYDKKPVLNININQNQYTIHQKLDLKIKLDNTVLPDSGLISIACIQEDKLDPSKTNDIESYVYLKDKLSELPDKGNYMAKGKTDKEFLEYVLLIKNWQRYTWLDMLNTSQTYSSNHWGNITFNGSVTSYEYAPTRRLSVVNVNHPLDIMLTDSLGRFIPADSSLITMYGKRVRFFVNGDKDGTYQIRISDPYLDITKKMVADMNLNDKYAAPQTSMLSQQDNFKHPVALKEVKITDATLKLPSVNIHYFSNECGDYVCRYNIFNCPNHPHERDNKKPQIGQFYDGLNGPYMGCDITKPHEFGFNGIYAAQEFYPSDLSQPNSPPEYLSTIYWKYLAKVTSSKEAEFSFYTNDLLGRFKIIIQGRTTNDVVYGEKTFEVKGK